MHLCDWPLPWTTSCTDHKSSQIIYRFIHAWVWPEAKPILVDHHWQWKREITLVEPLTVTWTEGKPVVKSPHAGQQPHNQSQAVQNNKSTLGTQQSSANRELLTLVLKQQPRHVKHGYRRCYLLRPTARRVTTLAMDANTRLAFPFVDVELGRNWR